MANDKSPVKKSGFFRSLWNAITSIFRPKPKGNPDSDMYPLW
jgi:hypothetical protein